MDYKSLLGWMVEHGKSKDNLEKYVMEAWARWNNRCNHTTVYKLQPRRPTQAISGQGWPNRFLGLSQCLNLDFDIFEFN